MSNAYNVRFCIDNVCEWSGVAITASSYVATLPPENVIHPYRTKVWKATGYDPEWVQFNLPTSFSDVQQVCLFNHNIQLLGSSPYQEVYVEASANANFSPIALTGTFTRLNDIVDVAIHDLLVEKDYQYWRIFTTRNPQTDAAEDVEIGYVYMGPVIDIPVQPNFKISHKDPSRNVYSIGGQRSAYNRDQYRTVSFQTADIENITDLNTIIDAVGTHKDFVLMLVPEYEAGVTPGKFGPAFNADLIYTLYGHLTSWDVQHRMNGACKVTFNFEEAR